MSEIVVDLLLDDKNFKSGLNSATKSATIAGEKIGKGITSPIKSSFKEVSSIAKGFVVGNVLLQLPRILSGAFTAVTNAAIVQEDAINSLNAALKRSGSFSQAASDDFQRFASEIQSGSILGDEFILSQIAIAKSFGLTNEQVKEFISAASNASAALDRDFNSTLLQLLKSLGGTAGELVDYNSTLRDFTPEQLKAGAAAKLFNEQYSGAARSQINTTSGSLSQLGNSFGDLTEKIGFFITESKTSKSIIRGLYQLISSGNLLLSDDVADKARLARIEYSALRVEVIKLENQIKNTSDPVFADSLREKLSFLNVDLKTAAAEYKSFSALITTPVESPAIANILSDKQVQELIAKFKLIGIGQFEQIRLQESEQIKALETARALNDDRVLSEEDFQQRLLEVKRQAIEQEAALLQPLRDAQAQFELEQREKLLAGEFNFRSFGEAGNEVFKSIAEDAKVTNKIVGQAVVNGIGGSISSGFAAFGAALANGENALAAFGKAFLQSIGQQAVALGTKFVLEGAAISFSPTSGGPAVGVPLIAKGTALAAFGGAISAFGGGGAGGGGAGGANNSQSDSFQPDRDLITSDTAEERAQAETRVSISVQGDIFDSEETGLRLSKILESASLNDNVRIFGGIA